MVALKPAASVQRWRPHPGPQTEAMQRSEFEVFFGGSRGPGKTEAGIAWLGEPEYINHPGYNSLVIRKNHIDLSDWVRRAKAFYGDMVEATDKKLKWRAGGSTILGHLKDKNAFEKYQGHEYQKTLCEELTQIPDEDSYLKLISSTRSVTHPELKPQVFATGNPGGRGHVWVKKRFVKMANQKAYRDPKSGRHRIFIPATMEDNPTLMENDPGYVAFIESIPGGLGKAWRHGDWDAIEGAFFTNFNTDFLSEPPFMIEPHVAHGRLYGSMDYGYGPNGRSSFGMWYVDESGMPHRLCTWARVGLTAREQADDLFDYIQSFTYTSGLFPQIVACDHNMFVNTREDAETKAPIDYFRDRFKGCITPEGWQPANKNRLNGWAIMSDYFNPDPITNEPIFRYFEGYNSSWEETIPLLEEDPNRPGDILKCPIDHEADESRYGFVLIYSSKKTIISGDSKKMIARAMQLEKAGMWRR